MPFYTRANAGEVLPDPASPLGWTLVFEQGLLPGWLRGLGRLRHLPRRRTARWTARRSPALFGGYFYINLSHCRVMAIRMGMTVEAFDAALLGSAEVAPPYKPHPDDVNEECSAKVGATIGEILGASSFPEIDEDLARVLGKRRDSARSVGAVRRRAGRPCAQFLARAGQRVRPARLLDARLGGRAGDAGRAVRGGGRAGGAARSDLRSRRGAVGLAVLGPVAAVARRPTRPAR